MRKYAVIFEKSSVALGFAREETKKLIRERANGDEIPEPSYVEMVEVA